MIYKLTCPLKQKMFWEVSPPEWEQPWNALIEIYWASWESQFLISKTDLDATQLTRWDPFLPCQWNFVSVHDVGVESTSMSLDMNEG